MQPINECFILYSIPFRNKHFSFDFILLPLKHSLLSNCKSF